MRKALFLLPLLAFPLSLTAHADTIDHFTITGDSHVYTFDLPQVFSFPDQLHLVALPAQRTTGTIDGVGGQTIDVSFYTGIFGSDSLGLSSPGVGFLLEGAPLVKLIGQSGTPGHLIDTAEITAAGSFSLLNFANSSLQGPDYFQVTITPETTPSIPEPSTILLLTTGALALLPTIRHRRALR